MFNDLTRSHHVVVAGLGGFVNGPAAIADPLKRQNYQETAT
jgi:hypothetical protein